MYRSVPLSYSFLFISNMLCDFSALGGRGVGGSRVVRKLYRFGGVGQCGKERERTPYDTPLYPVKGTNGLVVYKATYGPLINTALYVMV